MKTYLLFLLLLATLLLGRAAREHPRSGVARAAQRKLGFAVTSVGRVQPQRK